jgi:predicted nucleic acid-binding protein
MAASNQTSRGQIARPLADMNYLLDTNIIINAFYGIEPDATFVKEAIRNHTVYVSVVTVAEFFPKAHGEETKSFNKLIQISQMLDIDFDIAKKAGLYRKKFLHKRKRVHIMDCLIAAQAKTLNLTIITNNISDYPMRNIKVQKPVI